MVNFLVLFDRCKCCEVEERDEWERGETNTDRVDKVDKEDDKTYSDKIADIHKRNKKDHTWNIQQLERIYKMDSISVIEKYMIPSLLEKTKGKIKQTATYMYDRNFNIIETSNNLLEIIGIPQGLFKSANMYKWMSNIHKDCFEKILVRWILFKQKTMSGVKDIFIEKYRFVHGEEKDDGLTRRQNIRYTFSICKPVLSDTNFINNVKGELFEIDADTWFSLDL